MFKKIIPFFLLLFVSCSLTDQNIKLDKKKEIPPADKLYRTGVLEFEKGKMDSSVNYFKQIEKNYGYSKLAPKAILMISYIYYDANDYIKSLEYLKKFKELYPASKNIPYAEFLTAMCLYEEINLVSKDQQPTLLALKQFQKIIDMYPDSDYAKESKIRLGLVHEQLAGKEMYIARYYMKKEKWISAMIRLQLVIENYQNTIFIDEALHRMVEICYRTGDINNAKKYAAILGYNYNTSNWYKKTYKIVGDKNYTIINKKNKKTLSEKIKEKILELYSSSNND